MNGKHEALDIFHPILNVKSRYYIKNFLCGRSIKDCHILLEKMYILCFQLLLRFDIHPLISQCNSSYLEQPEIVQELFKKKELIVWKIVVIFWKIVLSCSCRLCLTSSSSTVCLLPRATHPPWALCLCLHQEYALYMHNPHFLICSISHRCIENERGTKIEAITKR